jgi:hypothetical protein
MTCKFNVIASEALAKREGRSNPHPRSDSKEDLQTILIRNKSGYQSFAFHSKGIQKKKHGKHFF